MINPIIQFTLEENHMEQAWSQPERWVQAWYICQLKSAQRKRTTNKRNRASRKTPTVY